MKRHDLGSRLDGSCPAARGRLRLCERSVGLAGGRYPARSLRLREGCRICACDVFDKSPFGLFDRSCMVRQAAGPSGLIDQAGLHSGYMASRKQKAQS